MNPNDPNQQDPNSSGASDTSSVPGDDQGTQVPADQGGVPTDTPGEMGGQATGGWTPPPADTQTEPEAPAPEEPASTETPATPAEETPVADTTGDTSGGNTGGQP